ncbi:MAG: DUF4142 domain-containing protein [Pseudonocardiaceae bacterium]
MKVTIAVGGLLGSLALVLNILILGVGSAAAQTVSPGAATANQQSGANQQGGGSQVSDQDRTFMMQNAQTDLAEITSGQTAAQRGTNEAIRQTGQTLTNDHRQALSELQNIAKANSVPLPTTPNAAQRQLANQLKSSTSAAFDQLYTSSGIKGHQMSIQGTQQEISSGSNAQVKQFATHYLPVAQKHLQMLQQLSSHKTPNK